MFLVGNDSVYIYGIDGELLEAVSEDVKAGLCVAILTECSDGERHGNYMELCPGGLP